MTGSPQLHNHRTLEEAHAAIVRDTFMRARVAEKNRLAKYARNYERGRLLCYYLCHQPDLLRVAMADIENPDVTRAVISELKSRLRFERRSDLSNPRRRSDVKSLLAGELYLLRNQKETWPAVQQAKDMAAFFWRVG